MISADNAREMSEQVSRHKLREQVEELIRRTTETAPQRGYIVLAYLTPSWLAVELGLAGYAVECVRRLDGWVTVVSWKRDAVWRFIHPRGFINSCAR